MIINLGIFALFCNANRELFIGIKQITGERGRCAFKLSEQEVAMLGLIHCLVGKACWL
jgi:hypothetical protein